MLLLTHADNVLGLDCMVQYAFKDNKLFAGLYIFTPFQYDNDEKLKNFNLVSESLNAKYELKREDTWYKDTWKDKPNDLGFAIGRGDVDLSEQGFKDKDSLIVIGHTLDKTNHTLGYMFQESLEKIFESYDDDI